MNNNKIIFSSDNIQKYIQILKALIGTQTTQKAIEQELDLNSTLDYTVLDTTLTPPRFIVYANGWTEGAGDTTSITCILNNGDNENSLSIQRIYIEGPFI